MSDHAKISGAFDAFMADSGSNDKRDAIVIYRAPRDGPLPSASKDPAARLEYVKQHADRQRAIYVSLRDAYELEALRRLTRKIELTTSSVGSNVLPIAKVEVTSRTLSVLAEQRDVVAILPNQKLHPIEPRAVDYRGVSRAESKAGITWGLKALGVPELWKTTRGEQINVAVLDTGVYGDHPCLSGRVRKFLVIDPLGRRIDARPSFDSGRHGTHVCGTIARRPYEAWNLHWSSTAGESTCGWRPTRQRHPQYADRGHFMGHRKRRPHHQHVIFRPKLLRTQVRRGFEAPTPLQHLAGRCGRQRQSR